MKSNWRYFVEDSVRRHLELQIMEATKHREAYGNSENPANSQIWVAIANLSKQIFETNLRIKFLEKTISRGRNILVKYKCQPLSFHRSCGTHKFYEQNVLQQ